MGRSGLWTWEQGEETEPATPAQAVTLAAWALKRSESTPTPARPALPAVLGEGVERGGYHLESDWLRL